MHIFTHLAVLAPSLHSSGRLFNLLIFGRRSVIIMLLAVRTTSVVFLLCGIVCAVSSFLRIRSIRSRESTPHYDDPKDDSTQQDDDRRLGDRGTNAREPTGPRFGGSARRKHYPAHLMLSVAFPVIATLVCFFVAGMWYIDFLSPPVFYDKKNGETHSPCKGTHFYPIVGVSYDVLHTIYFLWLHKKELVLRSAFNRVSRSHTSNFDVHARFCNPSLHRFHDVAFYTVLLAFIAFTLTTPVFMSDTPIDKSYVCQASDYQVSTQGNSAWAEYHSFSECRCSPLRSVLWAVHPRPYVSLVPTASVGDSFRPGKDTHHLSSLQFHHSSCSRSD